MFNLSGHVIKGYELQQQIGSGGFGAVYKAYQASVGREVAVKFILPDHANQPDFIRRFDLEAQLIARLEHPHIVPLHDFWRDPNGAYLVMRWLRGGSLQDMIEKGSVELDVALRLVEQISSALSLAHRHEVIHRDIKPGNILLDEDGNAYLADFGIAKDLTQIHDSVTHADAVVGSLDYLSPEQARGEPVTPRTDLYSLGVVLYEMLTGEHPFHEFSSVERLYMHINDPLPKLDNLALDTGVQEAINSVIQKATEKNPERRYSDISALAKAFHEAAESTDEGVTFSDEAQLTAREQETLGYLVEGLSNKEIAARMVVTVATVKWHVRQVFQKLGVRGRAQAIARALELGLVADPSGQQMAQKSTVTYLSHMDNPYKGLHAFEAADFRDFHGREILVNKLLSRMQEEETGARFLALVGPSGSGKSSVIKAGLMPALWQGKLSGSESWFTVEMLPGSHPLDELEIALMRVATEQVGNLHEQLSRDERGLMRTANLILPDDGSELVLIIDQFEEVFTLVEDNTVRQHFLDILRTAVLEPRSRVRVILTMRADFYDQPLHYPEFGDLLRSRMETILPLTAQGLERAVVGPADRVGVVFEQGLPALIVSEMTYQAGALPLLQYALTELFEHRDGRLLTHAAYQKIGGAVGALAQQAETVYLNLNSMTQNTARQMFLRLVTLGEGAEDTRRRATRTELMAIADDESIADELIDTYAEYRLLALDNDPATREPTVEVAHEAILREWVRLRQWLDEGRDDIRLQRQLANAANEWYEAKQDESFLLRGSRLEQFDEWADRSGLRLTGFEQDFLQTSLQRREEREHHEAARKAHESEIARRAQNFQRATAGLAIVVVLALLTIMVAIIQSNEAKSQLGTATIAQGEALNAQETSVAREQDALDAQQTSVARESDANTQVFIAGESLNEVATQQVKLQNGAYSYQMAGLAQLNSSNENDALAFAFEAVANEQVPVDVQFVYDNIAGNSRNRKTFYGHVNVSSVAFSPDGNLLASGSSNYTIKLWDVARGDELFTLRGHTESVVSLAFSPDGNMLASASYDDTVKLWDVDSGDELFTLSGHTDWVESVAFSPDSKTLASTSDDTTIKLWDVISGQEIASLTSHTDSVEGVAFSSDGKTLASGSKDDTIKLWDVQSGFEVATLSSDIGSINSVAFSPDGTIIAGGGSNGIKLWDVSTAEELRSFGLDVGSINSMAFSPNGNTLASASYFPFASPDLGLLVLWDVARGDELFTLTGHTKPVRSVAFSPNGNVLASGSWDNTVRLWDVGSLGEITTFSGSALCCSKVAFSPNGKILASASFNDMVKLLDVATHNEIMTLAGHTDPVYSVAFSPDGKTLASASQDQTVKVWDVASGNELTTLIGHSDAVFSIEFSPDGKTLASASGDATIKLWDVYTGVEYVTLSGHSNSVLDVAFSPDGITLASASIDTTVKLWDVKSGSELTTLSKHIEVVRSVAFSPDGKTLASSSQGFDRQIIFWDVTSGEPKATLTGHEFTTTDVAFSPDGKTLASVGSFDQTVRLWDVASGEELANLVDRGSRINSVAFSPDGTTLAFSSLTMFTKFWDISGLYYPPNWIQENRYIREFTCEERTQFNISVQCDDSGSFPTRTPNPTPTPIPLPSWTPFLTPLPIITSTSFPTLAFTPFYENPTALAHVEATNTAWALTQIPTGTPSSDISLTAVEAAQMTATGLAELFNPTATLTAKP